MKADTLTEKDIKRISKEEYYKLYKKPYWYFFAGFGTYWLLDLIFKVVK